MGVFAAGESVGVKKLPDGGLFGLKDLLRAFKPPAFVGKHGVFRYGFLQPVKLVGKSVAFGLHTVFSEKIAYAILI